MAAATCALATAFAVSACATDPMPDAFADQAPPQGDTELRALLGDGPDVVVAGTRLDAGLLRRFYKRHGYEPVWATRHDQADTLLQAVLRARDHGLDPALFHPTLARNGTARNGAALSPLERDVLLSGSILSYSDALARGAVPIERRRDDEALKPDPIDVSAVLVTAMASAHPAAVIDALAPDTPEYQALREALQTVRSGPHAGMPGPMHRARTLEVNLERQRWLPRQLPAHRVWVNVADEGLVLYRPDQPRFSTRVVVGEDVKRNQSPEFRATIDASFYNPPWVIPADIATAEILPKVKLDPEYLTRNRMVLLAHGEIEQLPGPEAGLGLIMFDMPNRFDVYLHDTPDRSVFARENRRISHGCIRVQRPRELAALLMDQTLDTIDEGIAAGGTTRHTLPAPVPVFVVYQTAFLDAHGTTVLYRPDFYDRDAAIWQKMQPSSRATHIT